MQRILFWFGLLAIAWGAGFYFFVKQLPRPPQKPPVQNENVIVLTGGGGARIKAAMQVFAEGERNRMLISGVNPAVSRDSIASLWPGSPDKFDCCIDLGREARSTFGNALEARDWINLHEYESILLVTSEFHMPRAILELKMQSPNTIITAYPVRSAGFSENGFPKSAESWRQVAGEYSKYLIARLRALFN